MLNMIGRIDDYEQGQLGYLKGKREDTTMAQPLRLRFNSNRDEVLEYTANFGRWKAMTKFNIKDYLAFTRFLREMTGNENFGFKPKLNLNGNQSLGDQLIEAMLRKVADLETKVAERNKRIEFLEWQLNIKREADELKALAVLEVCKT